MSLREELKISLPEIVSRGVTEYKQNMLSVTDIYTNSSCFYTIEFILFAMIIITGKIEENEIKF